MAVFHQEESMKKVIKKARIRLADYIATLPGPLDDLADRYTKVPDSDGLSDDRIGEKYAFCIGNLFDIREEEILEIATFGCIVGCAFAYIQDQRIDSQQQGHVEKEVVGNLLFIKAMESFHSLVSDNPKFWNYMHKYFQDLSLAYLREAKDHHKNFKRFESEDVQMVADRSAPLNVCVAALALYADMEHEIEIAVESMRHVVFGLQIGDDLSDWREDFQAGNWTYPITLAMEQLMEYDPSRDMQSFQEREIESMLLVSDIAEQLLEQSTSQFQIAKEKLAYLNPVILCNLLDTMIASNERRKTESTALKVEALIKWKLLPS